MMSLVIVVVLALTTLTKANTGWTQNVHPRVVGGDEATLHQFPYQVALLIDGWRFCGGSILSDRTVITAAHCLNRAKYAVVITGAHDIAEDGSAESEKNRGVYLSQKLILHENWNYTKPGVNDIALVILESEAIELMVNVTVAIDRHEVNCPDTTLEDKSATVSGWGKTSDASSSVLTGILRYAADKIINNHECNSNYGNIEDTHVCLDGQKLAGVCNGDSGGPLIYYDLSLKPVLAGITSYGSAWGCQAGFPSVYTRVSCFKSWIDGNMVPKPAP